MSRKKDIRGASLSKKAIVFIVLAVVAVLIAAALLALFFTGFRRKTMTYISSFDASEQTISFMGFVDRNGAIRSGRLTYENQSAKAEKQDDGTYKLTFENGDVYIGEMDGLQRQGSGTMIYATGEKYEGQFLNDRFNGEGTFTFVNGDVYTGSFAGGKKNGTGRYVWAEVNGKSAVYVGSFRNDRRNGQGEYTEANGTTYIGKYVDDLRCDENATVYIKTEAGAEDRYIGGYKNDRRSGFGCYFYANGDVYVGQFENNNLNGKGVIYFADGGSYEGEFEQGNLKAETAVEIPPEEAAARLADVYAEYPDTRT